ncbi:Uma2 family endonuclease [Desulfonema limicola]|nr:Uma2 family endonuclease [Desulfonema limicola]
MPASIQALERQGPPEIHYIPYRKDEITYPESDGRPMADNTKQFNWIVKIKEGLEVMFADRPDVFVAGDLLWYPVKGDNKKRAAPDAMVVFGRPKGHRGAYIQYKEEDIAPQVVFEVLSPGNTKAEMKKKLGFYRQYGVEEYYIYDPDNITFEGWLRTSGKLLKIKKIQGWTSPRLGIRFELTDEELFIYRPDGQKFLSFVETEEKAVKAQKQAEKERIQREQAQKQAEKAEALANQEKKRAEMLAEKLIKLGISLDDL